MRRGKILEAGDQWTRKLERAQAARQIEGTQLVVQKLGSWVGRTSFGLNERTAMSL